MRHLVLWGLTATLAAAGCASRPDQAFSTALSRYGRPCAPLLAQAETQEDAPAHVRSDAVEDQPAW